MPAANGMVLAQVKTGEHSNEITVIPALLDLLSKSKISSMMSPMRISQSHAEVYYDGPWHPHHR
ncbi:MAG: hypothetical protein EA404_11705 [Spirochaetaceae bacterium]|nr:MAG: hypothetical protein EA404_11705 [Spirochaetaceae bacterium]